jgi:hypothetical protein
LPALSLLALVRDPTAAVASTEAMRQAVPQAPPSEPIAMKVDAPRTEVGALAYYTCNAPWRIGVRVRTLGGSRVYLEPPSSGALRHSVIYDHAGDPNHVVYSTQTHTRFDGAARSGTWWVGVLAFDGPLGANSSYSVFCWS